MNPKFAREAEAAEFGRKLKGFGINLLVSDILASVNFLREVLQMKVHRNNHDFAVAQSGRAYFQLLLLAQPMGQDVKERRAWNHSHYCMYSYEVIKGTNCFFFRICWISRIVYILEILDNILYFQGIKCSWSTNGNIGKITRPLR